METVSVNVPGLGRLGRLPGAIENGQRQFVSRLSRELAYEIRSHIRSRANGDNLASHWQGRGIDSTHGIVEAVGPAYLKASVQGAFVIAKKGKVLRFIGRDGTVVFRKWIRLTPGDYIGQPDDRKTSYVTLALQLKSRRAVAERAFEETFGHLEGT